MDTISAMTSRSSELCFNKEVFTTKDFSVDRFVSEYRKQIPLETLKEDLGLFLKVLQSAMVELINKDYADFVNLSTNLVGLDKSINNLRIPIEQVQREIGSFCSVLNDAIEKLQNLLKVREEIHVKKTKLHRVICILEGIDNIKKQDLKPVKESPDKLLPCEVIERVAVELNKVQFHVNLTLDVRIIREKQTLIEELSNILSEHLELMFLKSLTNGNQEDLFKVLRIYSFIDKINEVEHTFRTKIVRPYMREVIHENVIENEGISKMYDEVLSFIPNKCSIILNITRGGKKDTKILKGYDFLINSVWPEIVICLEYISTVVYAPGNPSLFHKNYTASMAFLNKFECSCIVQSSVHRLREHSSYKSFMKKWDIYVYFEIRFQEIGSTFETALLSAFKPPENRSIYYLNSTHVLQICIERCWADDVYISSLYSDFWKLTLQLLSRHCIWINNVMNEIKDGNSFEDPMFNNLSGNNQEPAQVSIKTLVLLVKDIEVLSNEMYKYFEKVVLSKLSLKDKIFYNVIREQNEVYKKIPDDIGKIIIKRLTNQCSQHLKLITDIPRLYRKTNREVPSRPSNYVALLFNPLETFLTQTESLLSQKLTADWTTCVIENVIEQYFNMINDVIVSVKKMEDSLKRLKKAREKPIGQTASGISDDDKIRRQLLIDVETIGSVLEKYKFSKTKDNYKKLLSLVQSAAKTSNIKS